MKQIADIHNEISLIRSRDSERITKTSLAEIPEAEGEPWESVRSKIQRGEVQVREMTVSPVSFELLSDSGEKNTFRLLSMLAYLLPIAAVVLAFTFHWWYVFLAVAAVPIFRSAKAVMTRTVLQGATQSEQIFSFFFSRNAICVVINGELIYRRNT